MEVMTNQPTPQPSGRTAEEILDQYSFDVQNLIADHKPFKDSIQANRWQREALRQLFDTMLEIVKQVEREGRHYYDGEKNSYSDNGEYALEQVEQKLRLFFGQPEGSETVYEDTNKRFLAQPPMFDLEDNQPEASGKDGGN